MSNLSWVVGRGGLFGSSVERVIGSTAFHPEEPFEWDDRSRLREKFAIAVQSFNERLQAHPTSGWRIYWCAGAGVVGTSSAALAQETATLQWFLGQLAGALDSLPDRPGEIFLASSAGGVYGGSSDRPITEATSPNPISPYGRAKLEQENIVRDWAQSRRSVSVLIGRISNLYGPGQRLDKPQGLISHMCRCILFNVPVRIYVPLDTIRDYFFADDAAAQIVEGMERLHREASQGGSCVVKLYASESETTIAELIGLFRQLAKRHLRLISGRNSVGAEQPPKLQFRSAIWVDKTPRPPIELLDGMNRVYRHQLRLLQAGELPRPV